MTLTYASMFAGLGGFDYGFDRQGWTATYQCDFNQHCQTILGRHWPTVPKGKDIRDVTGADLGAPDVLVGGFPCQGVSGGAPNRLGLADPRSSNFFEFARLVYEHLRLAGKSGARWVVIENPVGLLTSPGVDKASGVDRTGWDMAAVARGLDDLGYGWAYRVVDARDTGSAQRRERVIVVGHRGGDPRPAQQVLGLAGPSLEAAPARAVGTRRRPAAARGTEGDSGAVVWRKSARARASLAKGGYETWVQDPFSNTLTCFDGGTATRQTHLVLQDGRIRALTFTERERLTGLPDGWTEGVPDSARDDMIGNAMNADMATWLAGQIEAVHTALPMLPAA